MDPLSTNELQRLELLIPRFYHELLSEVDRRAREHGAEDITDACGLALTLWLTAGAAVYPDNPAYADVSRQLETLMTREDIAGMVAVFGDHIEEEHGEYLPLFRAAIRTPHVQSLSEQLQAFAKRCGMKFDPTQDIDRS